MSILRNELSSFSWTEKAVLILTAFAVDYGDFWALVKLQSFDSLVELVGVTKREPTTINCPDLIKCEKEIGDISYLIKDTLEAIKCIIEFERQSNWADTRGIKTTLLTTVTDSIPLHVYWVIVTVVACTTQMFCLSNDTVKTMDLSPLIEKMSTNLDLLKKNVHDCGQQIVKPMRQRILAVKATGPGVYVSEDYTFLYGSTNNGWKDQFLGYVTNIIRDLAVNHPKISIRKQDVLKLNSGKLKVRAKELQARFKSDRGYVELYKDSRIIVGDYGTTIVKVLEKFDDWKGSLNQFGFGDCFKDYYDN
ncbi:protein SIEVE ELEMENT OCCLUSION B-like [Juglans regia]|nr:protein SIEVE ELEMENT OCCLUSION B-like [Juglans regia]